MPARSYNTGQFRVIQDDKYEFHGRQVYRETHGGASSLKRFLTHVREGFALSRRAFDDIDARPTRKGKERRHG